MANVTPELKSQIEKYLQERQKGEIELLSFFYKELFGRELRVNCSICIEDAITHIKKVVIKKERMNNWKWIGGKNTVNVRIGDSILNIGVHNCTDVYAEKISSISKYSHLVEYVGEQEPVIKKKEEEFTKVGLVDFILTSEEVKTEEEPVKKKRGRPKLK